MMPSSATPTALDRRLLGALLLLVTAHLAWTFTSAGTPEVRSAIGNAAFLPVYTLSAMLAARAARRHTGRLKQAWRYFTLGLACWTAGQAVYAYRDLLTEANPFPSVADIGFLALVPCFVLGIRRAVRAPQARWHNLTFVLDAAMVLVALGALYWHAFLAGNIARNLHEPFALGVTLAYLASHLVLIATVFTTVLWRPRDVTTPTHLLFIAGLVSYLVVDVLYQHRISIDAYTIGTPLDSLWMLGAALFALSAFISHSELNARPVWRRLGAAWQACAPIVLFCLPYSAMLLAFGIALEHQTHSDNDLEAVGIKIATGIIVALAFARLIGTQLITHVLQRQLDLQARHDPLTGLPNRAQFGEVLEAALRRTRGSQDLIAVMFVDLDRFKGINDTFGHTTGDQLLRQAAQRIQGCLRRDDFISRFGSDEFVLMLPHVTNVNAATSVAQRIVHALGKPFTVEGRELAVTASLGLTICPTDTQDTQTAVRYAGLAMQQAKQSGKNTLRYFNDTLQERAAEQFHLESELQLALDRGEFELHYQPLQDLRTRELRAFEALLRWNSRTLGRVPPDRFIPTAEERGSIVEIGAWVLNEAARQVREWRDLYHVDLRVSVNVSGVQFASADFVGLVERTLRRHDLPGAALELELTESVLIHDIAASNAKLLQLKGLGVRVALDDFGTGYSSLAYLRLLHVDVLKIDRSFVWAMDDNGSAFVQAIVNLAHHLKLETVAEGIETQAQAEQLAWLKCELGQGYFLDKPMPASDAERKLSSVQVTPELP